MYTCSPKAPADVTGAVYYLRLVDIRQKPKGISTSNRHRERGLERQLVRVARLRQDADTCGDRRRLNRSAATRRTLKPEHVQEVDVRLVERARQVLDLDLVRVQERHLV